MDVRAKSADDSQFFVNADMKDGNKEYHERKEISASDLKLMDQSWRLYEASKITGELRRDPTGSMELGTAVHTAALEPERYFVEYVVQPNGLNDRRTKAYKEWSETVHASQTILKQETAVVVRRCVESLNSHPIIGTLLRLDGNVERSYLWTCKTTGVECRFRPDKITPKTYVILDIKTIQACSEHSFAKAVTDFRYDLQAAHYLAGATEIYGDGDWMFVFAAIETSPPFRCRAFSLDTEALRFGCDTREGLLSEYARRAEANDWRDPRESELISISLPTWFLRRA